MRLLFLYNIANVLTNKGLAAGDVGKGHFRQQANIIQGDLFLRAGGVLKAVAHIAVGVAPIGNNHSAV